MTSTSVDINNNLQKMLAYALQRVQVQLRAMVIMMAPYMLAESSCSIERQRNCIWAQQSSVHDLLVGALQINQLCEFVFEAPQSRCNPLVDQCGITYQAIGFAFLLGWLCVLH